jgi:fumarylacetoacetase
MAARSWVASANGGLTDFPLENLPYGVFSEAAKAPRCGVAIGDRVLDVAAMEREGVVVLAGGPLLQEPRWNPLMAAGPAVWAALRERLTALLAEGAAERAAVEPHLVPRTDVALHLPFRVAEYTDFYAGLHHAFNVGSMFRGAENALPANWLSIPIGYNGRASSVVVSGTDVRRPWGQVKGPDEALPRFAPSERFDLELELGAIVGSPSAGMVSVAEADDMIFGYVLLNDWSARDIQAWESQPLGPFLAKSFASTISPWIVTLEALEPYRCPAFARAADDPKPLPYLWDEDDQRAGGFAIEVEMHLQSAKMRAPARLSRASFRDSYWTVAQMVAHHTSNGCNLRPGDLLGSGTLSGAAPGSFGSMMELTQGGNNPLSLPGGETRAFLEDGDEVIEKGYCEGNALRIGFGEAGGVIKS